jgi:hypothetical protein
LPDLEHEEAKKRRKKGSSLLRVLVLSSDFVIAVATAIAHELGLV